MANQFGIDLGQVQDRRRQRVVNAQNNKLFDLQVQQQQQQQQTAQQRNALFGQFGQANTIPQRQAIAQQTYSVDPQAALQMEKRIAEMSEQQRAQTEQVTNAVAKGAASILTLPPEQFDQAYADGLTQFAQRFGPDAVKDAPNMSQPPEVRRAYLQQMADEALTTKEILDRQKNPNSTFGQPKEVVGPDGKPMLVQFDKDGNARPVGGFAPTPDKGGISFRTGPQGTEVSIGGEPLPQNQALTKSATNTIQKDLAALEETSARVRSIGERYNPSFLTFQGKISANISALKNKANIDLSEEDRKHLKEYTQFKTLVNRDFNAYRKLITGAAASVQELESLKLATISDDQSPAEFEANLEVYQEELMRTMRIKRRLLREGLSVGDKGFGDMFDNLYLNGSDDDSELRFAELQADGLDEAEAIDRLIDEGYK